MKYQLIDSEVEFIQAKKDNFEQLKELVKPNFLDKYQYTPNFEFEGQVTEGYQIVEFDRSIPVASYIVGYGEYIGVSKQNKIFVFETEEELLKQFTKVI